ncbi:MAG: LPS assembly lipoprotein LptE [Pirellulaceae bacterium]
MKVERNMMKRVYLRLIPMVVLVMVTISVGCRGYHLGNQYSFRNDIRSVHVGIVESDSYRYFLGQQLTEAVTKEIELHTPYVITEPALADSFLQARILKDSKRVIGENRFDEPRSLEYGWQIEVTWVDRAGVPLMERQVVRIDEDVTFIPEAGQSLSTAQLQLITRLARQIVGQMESPW